MYSNKRAGTVSKVYTYQGFRLVRRGYTWTVYHPCGSELAEASTRRAVEAAVDTWLWRESQGR